jgi:hypothetical protein
VQIPYPATLFWRKIPFVIDPGLWSSRGRLAKLTSNIGSRASPHSGLRSQERSLFGLSVRLDRRT